MVNVLLLAPQPFFQDRGTPIAVRLVLEGLSEEGHSVKVLTYPEGENIRVEGCEIVRLPMLPALQNVRPGFSWKKILYDILMLAKARRLTELGQADIVHAVEEAAFIALHLKRRFGVPYVYDMDSCLPLQMVEKYGFLRIFLPILDRLERVAIQESEGVLAVCSAIEKRVRTLDPGKRVQRIEDVSLLSQEDSCGRDDGEKLKLNGPIVMYVGNLEKYQGIDLLLESFERVIREIPSANLVIVGGARRDIEKYRTRTTKLGINDKIMFTGPKPTYDLGKYLGQADVLVSPRIKGNNTPMKIYSYMDSGRPIVATRLPTHVQVLTDDVACLVEPNTRALADGLVRLLRDSSYGETLGMRAKACVRQEYTVEGHRKKLLAFYRELEGAIWTDRCSQPKAPQNV